MQKNVNIFTIAVTVTLMAGLFIPIPSDATELTVYSSRMEQLIQPVFDAYTQTTGVSIKFITDKDGPLLQRLSREGADSPADIFMTVDAGALWKAAHDNLLKPVSSPTLLVNIPPHLRDPQHRWFGLSVRARTLVFNTQKVKPALLTTYEALGNPEWKNRICLRTSKSVYNQSLVAMMIAEMGMAQTEKIVAGWVANLAIDPAPDDTKLLEAIAAGICDVGIVNSYYYGRLIKKNPNLPLSLFWPNQKDRGVHVNVSGAGVVRSTKQASAAVKFLEWLSSKEAQNLFADVNFEYPVNAQVLPHRTVAKWGTFVQSKMNVGDAGRLQVEAIKLMDRVGYR